MGNRVISDFNIDLILSSFNCQLEDYKKFKLESDLYMMLGMLNAYGCLVGGDEHFDYMQKQIDEIIEANKKEREMKCQK